MVSGFCVLRHKKASACPAADACLYFVIALDTVERLRKVSEYVVDMLRSD